jgi:sulfate-transporting ATPase
MSTVWQFFLLGVGLSPAYILAAQGTVLVYRGSGVVNFAQGAFALIGAFASLELQNAGLSPMLALVGGVIAAAVTGAITYALVMRRLTSASQLVRVVATLGVSVVVTQALALHYADNQYFPSPIVSEANLHIFGAHISRYEVVLFAFSIVLTAALWGVYRFTKFGLKTSAVSENPRSAAALGHSPEVTGLLNWIAGGALGGLAGILIAPDIGLTTQTIGLLLVPALAAAVLGRFSSFWLTLLGGLIVAIGTSELTRYNPGTGWSDAFPFLVVIAILLFRSSALPGRGEAAARLPRIGTGHVRWPLVIAGAVVLAVIIAVIPAGGQAAMTISLTAAILCLSVTVVTGYAGQVSLAQLGLAGVGGFAAAKLSAEAGFTFWEALVAGVAVALPVGAIVGLPALRARGVNLAIVTLGLGLTIQDVLLNNPNFQNAGGGFQTKPPSLFGFSLDSTFYPGRYAMLCLVLFTVCALLVANVRRGRVGRHLIALRANERAAAALGINVTLAKLYAFVVSAGLAAVAGVLIAFQPSIAVFVPGGGGPTFDSITSITLLSLVVVGGIGYVGGSILAGQLFAAGIGAWILEKIFTSPDASGWLALAGGLGALLVVLFNPNGLAANQVDAFAKWSRRLPLPGRRRRPRPPVAQRPVPAPAVAASDCTLTIENLSARFGGVVALSGVSLSVRSGEIVGLIGPNGAGKSTLIDAVSGFNRRYGGRILLDGEPIDGATATARARMGIGRSFQSPELFDDMTVEDNLLAGSELPKARDYLINLIAPGKQVLSPAAIAAVNEFELEPCLAAVPPELPYGRRRLVGIARALSAGPRILLLDEPAAGLDDRESGELATLLRRLASERGVGILLVEHNVNLVMSVSDRVTALDFGNVIAEGAPERVRCDPAVVAAYLGASTADETDGSSGSNRESGALKR